VSLQPRAHGGLEHMVVYSCALTTAKGVHISGGKQKGPGAYELPKAAECSTSNFTCTDIEM